MQNDVPALLLFTLGTYLIWCGMTGRNPLDTAKAILQGKTVPPKKTITGQVTPSSNITPTPPPSSTSQTPSQGIPV